MQKTELTRADILPMEEYGRQRAARRRALVAAKRVRRLAVGPCLTVYFENYETMWQQVHEMLYVERGGEAQIEGELKAYNPLVPKGHDLSATAMFEIDNPVRRQELLSRLGGVERTVEIRVGGQAVTARREEEVLGGERGRTPSVHFLHFDFSPEQIAAFRVPGAQVVVAVTHPEYGHMAVMPEAVRAALAGDFA